MAGRSPQNSEQRSGDRAETAEEKWDRETEEIVAEIFDSIEPDSSSDTSGPALVAEPVPPASTEPVASPSVAPTAGATKPSAAPAGYHFPTSSSAALHGLDLNKLVDDLSRKRHAAGSALVSYWDVRDELCAVQLALNARGSQPPAFRATRRSPPSKSPNPEHVAISLDRKMIDLHWIHCRGFRRPLNDGKYRDLMTEDEFDFASAELFVTENWKTDVRVNKILGLTEFEQWQMGVLVSDSVRKRRTQLENERVRIEQALRSLAQRTRNLHEQQAADLSDLWFANALCNGKNLDLIGRVHGWIRGEPPLANTTLTNKRRTMLKRVAQALGPSSISGS